MSRRDFRGIDIFLQPGEFYFGDAGTRVRTLLGSCVSIVIWHPRRKLGGMCHYLLPSSVPAHHEAAPGRYAAGAVALFTEEIRRARTRPDEYTVKLFGGGRMFQRPQGNRTDLLDIGVRNVAAGRELLISAGFGVNAEHVAGRGHRSVLFDIGTGEVWLRHVATAVVQGNVPP